MKKKAVLSGTFIILLAIGAALLFFGTRMIHDRNVKKTYFEKTTGVVTDIHTSEDDEGGTTYAAVYTYNVNGTDYRTRDDVYTSHRPNLGETAEILYDPSNPSDSFSANGPNAGIFLVIAGAVFCLGSLTVLFSEKKGIISEFLQTLVFSSIFMGMGFGLFFSFRIGLGGAGIFLLIMGALGALIFISAFKTLFTKLKAPIAGAVLSASNNANSANSARYTAAPQQPMAGSDDVTSGSNSYGSESRGFAPYSVEDTTGKSRGFAPYSVEDTYFDSGSADNTNAFSYGTSNYQSTENPVRISSESLLKKSGENTSGYAFTDTYHAGLTNGIPYGPVENDKLQKAALIFDKGQNIFAGAASIFAGGIFVAASIFFTYNFMQPTTQTDGTPDIFFYLFFGVFFVVGAATIIKGIRIILGK